MIIIPTNPTAQGEPSAISSVINVGKFPGFSKKGMLTIGDEIYCANYGGNSQETGVGSVSVINTVSNSVTHTINSSSWYYGASVLAKSLNGTLVYVSTHSKIGGNSQIYALNIATKSITATGSGAYLGSTTGIATPSTTSYIYVCNNNSYYGVFLDKTNLGGNLANPTSIYTPQGCISKADGSKSYYAGYYYGQGNAIAIHDSGFGYVTNIQTTHMPIDMLLSPNESKLYFMGQSTANLYVISTTTNTITKTIPLPTTYATGHLAFSSFWKRIYCVDPTNNCIHVVNSETEEFIKTISINNPGSACVGSDNKLYVANPSNHTVSVIS